MQIRCHFLRATDFEQAVANTRFEWNRKARKLFGNGYTFISGIRIEIRTDSG
jgi:hypothetical protein